MLGFKCTGTFITFIIASVLGPGSAFIVTNNHNNVGINSPSCPRKDHLKLPQYDIASLNVRGGGFESIQNMKQQTQLYMQLNPAAASLIAGSIAGAIGVGVAFPLDTLKTKSQVYGQQDVKLQPNSDQSASAIPVSQMNMFQLIGYIYKMEGLEGFFGGVKGMMVGQAMIKAMAFATNAFTLDYLKTNFASLPSTPALLIAACTAGFITSFLVTPIERVKVMMQASKKYTNEFTCMQAIVKTEGLGGLMSRGLGTTIGREVPSYGIYFFLYGFLSQLPIAASLGMTAPLFFGALSGMASWLPVYPVDVVKTLVQNTDGSDTISTVDVAKQLYSERGIGGFFDGIVPKMLRAAINHAVTFYCYDMAMGVLKP